MDISTEPSPAVGTGAGSSPFDSYAPWKDMEEYNIINNAVSHKRGESGFSRTSYDTMVYIPEFWFKIVESGNYRYFYIANKAKDGFTKHPGSGKYVGRYNTVSGNASKSGAAPQASQTRAQFRSGARNKGSKWSLHDFAAWNAVWLLYLVEFADWNSQAQIGRGNVDSSSLKNAGGTDSMSYHTGRASGTDGKTQVSSALSGRWPGRSRTSGSCGRFMPCSSPAAAAWLSGTTSANGWRTTTWRSWTTTS